jgi:flagellar biogenesis protein FliO
MTPRLAICVWIGMTIGSFEEARKNPYSFWFMVVSIVVAIIIVILLSHVVKKALAQYDPEANGAAPANKIA